MKKFVCFLTVCLMISMGRAQVFLPHTEDIPQEDSLNQIEEIANFDSPDGRLLILTAVSTKSPRSIERYYDQTLKNLGWKKVKKTVYQRQNDSVQIEISQKQNQTFVQFTLSQKNN